jgi:lactoylglutathione lyase
MAFVFDHTNINVTDLERSVAFYEKALGLKVLSRKEAGDGSFVLCFMGDGKSAYKMELTWLRDKEGPYALGDNETHMCFKAEDYESAHALHQEMGCICYENTAMGLYFIEDPDGYWVEITPKDE